MNPEIEQKLFAHLESQDQERQQTETRATDVQRVLEKNDADFRAKKKDTIRPALEELVDLYRSKGITLRIFETEVALNREGTIREATIGLDTKAAFSHSSGDMKPEFRLSYSRRSRKIGLYTTTPAQGSPGGDIPLDEITEEWIHEKFLAYVAPEKRRLQFGEVR